MPAATVLLAPGASGGAERLAPHVDGIERRGLAAEIVALPRGSAERAVPAYRVEFRRHPGSDTVIGGHSFGGRVASLLAADEPPAGLVLLSYPLHAPGRHDAWSSRTDHWPRIRCPVLVLSGESDPFARLDLLRRAVRRLPDARFVTYPRVGHSLMPVLDEALDEVAGFVAERT